MKTKKKVIGILCAFLATAMILPTSIVVAPEEEEIKGPYLDQIIVKAVTSQEIGIMDASEGHIDLFYWAVSGDTFKQFPSKVLEKLELYPQQGGYWSLIFNPIPNEAPYLVEVGGKEYFNPFAIREIRFAMNFLIDREYLIDEVLGGSGMPDYCPVKVYEPSYPLFSEIIAKYGLKPEGDVDLALAEIDEQMQKAASLPELEGRLVKEDRWWTFDGEPVTVKFLIRIEDERHEEGMFIAEMIEKAGIKVDRLERERSVCIGHVFYKDPAEYTWNIYTEGWLSGAADLDPASSIAQMYAPWRVDMPGGGEPTWWNYLNPEIDEATKKATLGQVETEEEFWEGLKTGVDIGIYESVRIFIATQEELYAVNADRVTERMLYDVGAGLGTRWALISAKTPDKVLTLAEFGAPGQLFMSAWNPQLGMTDVYTVFIWRPVRDYGLYTNPRTGEIIPVRTIPVEIDKSFHLEDGEVIGEILVPEDAVLYDPVAETWYEVGPNVNSVSKVTCEQLWSNWHHGEPMGMEDFLQDVAFGMEWATEDEPGDPYFSGRFSSANLDTLQMIKGIVIDSDDTMTLYLDYNHPMSDLRIAAWFNDLYREMGLIFPTLPWEILEAMSRVVAEGGKSGESYAFMQKEGVEWLDLLVKAHVTDLRSALVEMKENNYVPPAVKGFISPEEAKERYDAAISWIDEHDHAVISSGPFYVESYSPVGPYLDLRAFRDPTYPFTPDTWPTRMAVTSLELTKIDAPVVSVRGIDIPVKIHASEKVYPIDELTPATEGFVTVTLRDPTGDVFSERATLLEPGLFGVTIPGDLTKDLAEGSYTLMVSGSYTEKEYPMTISQEILIFG